MTPARRRRLVSLAVFAVGLSFGLAVAGTSRPTRIASIAAFAVTLTSIVLAFRENRR